MALDNDTREEIIRRHEAGEDTKSIARDLGINPPIAVFGLIRQHRIRLGLEEPPARGVRRAKAERTKRVTVKTAQAFDVPDGAQVGVISAGDAVAPVGLTSSPLFPKRPDGELDRIEVRRVIARPRAAGTGLLGALDPDAGPEVIGEAFGGGRYDLRGFNSVGKLIARNSLDVAGRSKPVDIEQEEAEAYVPDAAPVRDPVMEHLMAELRQSRELMHHMAEERARESRESAEREIRREREAMAAREQHNTSFFAAMQQLQQTAFERMLAVERSSGPSNSLKDHLEELALLRETFGENDSGSRSTLDRAIDAIPETLRSIVEMKTGVITGRVPPVAPQMAPPMQAIPDRATPIHPPQPAQPVVAPNQAQPQTAQPVDQDAPMTADEIAVETYHSAVANGFTEQEASEKATALLNILRSQFASAQSRKGNGQAAAATRQ